MSVNLFITLQKYTQQIDLTKKDWLPDRVFISRKFTHLTIHPQKKQKNASNALTEHSFLTTDGGVGWVYNEHSALTASR